MNENQLEQYLFQETEELMSYSSSFEARSRDRFVVFINELFELGSHKEYNTMFHSDRVVLENKSRRLMDYLEVESFIDRIEIVSLYHTGGSCGAPGVFSSGGCCGCQASFYGRE